MFSKNSHWSKKLSGLGIDNYFSEPSRKFLNLSSLLEFTHSENINIKGEEGESLLHHLASLGWVEAIHLIGKSGAFINAMDNHHRTPLYCAVCKGHYLAALTLISMGADYRKTPSHDRLLIRAIECNSKPLVELILDQGANPNEGNRFGWFSPLAVAIQKTPWPVDIISCLLQAGAHPNSALANGEIISHVVAKRKQDPNFKEVWTLLEKYGAHFDLPNEQGVSAFQILEKKDEIMVFKSHPIKNLKK